MINQPAYYGTVDTNADQACNTVPQANINENWTLVDFIGLDNDGDNLYDIDDDDCGTTPVPPEPDVKANGLDAGVTVSAGEILAVDVSLLDGDPPGKPADWWVVAQTSMAPPKNIYHYQAGGDSWVPGLAPTHSGPLSDLAPFQVLNTSGLPPGSYLFHFGVDLNMNGMLDLGDLILDTVDVTILPAP